MAKVIPLQQALKLFFALIVAIVVLDGGGTLSDHLVASPSAGLRWLGVATAIVSLLPWLGVIVWPLTHLDEYHRRIVLVGTAASFVVDLLVHTGFNVIVDAHLVGPTSYLPTLPVAMGIWILSVGATALYYRASA
jgi:hypothetical protein